jgi:aspartyl-tRNA synthetase
MTFFTLRDRYGVTQVNCNPDHVTAELSDIAASLKNEYVVKVSGLVLSRPDTMVNENMATGTIELIPQSIEIITKAKELPFQIIDDPKTSDEIRYKHRYLDLRRKKILDNIQFRAQMNQFTRNWFSDKWFLEVQTPLFTVSSPEGARDYIIPSRVNPGKFYALPQAPQQYKQLLMIGWIDKYFQIAPCFRDEDPRADRHSCEFYQIDCEMSFVEQEDVFTVAEWYIHDLIPALVPHKTITVDCKRLSYADAINLYWSDKPDLRFGMEFIDVSDVVRTSSFPLFTDTVANWQTVKAIRLSGQTMSRKEFDEITDVAKRGGASGLPYLVWDAEGIKWSISKFFDEENVKALTEKIWAVVWDIVFFAAGEPASAGKVLNVVRLFLRDKYALVDQNHLAFVWITNFPFYEMNDEGKLDFAHNPFSHITGGVEALENQDPLHLVSEQYDMVCNGYEILSGSIRNHDADVLIKAFEKVGKGEKEVKDKFGAMYEAFQFGAPPHGWFAFGFDRLLMILKDEENIREIYAFPKSGRAEDVMMWAPSYLDEEQLQEMHITNIDKDISPGE